MATKETPVKELPKKLSAQELYSMNPAEMTTEQYTQLIAMQKKMAQSRDVEMKSYEKEVYFKELEAREFKATRDQKVYNLENMKATIEMEELFDKYQATLNLGKERMETLRAKQAEEEKLQQAKALKDFEAEKNKASTAFADSLAVS